MKLHMIESFPVAEESGVQLVAPIVVRPATRIVRNARRIAALRFIAANTSEEI